MAINAGTVQASSTVSLSGFKAGMDEMRSQGERAAAQVERRFRDMGRGMNRVGRQMTRWITAPFLAVGGMAVKTAADFESLRQSMDALNGSAEEGARNFERLVQFSARTPFQLQDLAQAQNMLQGFGLAADDAFQSLSMIGDIAAITGGDIDGIGIAFGQAAAEGRLMTRDIRQFINQGVPMVKMLADTMGVAQSEILTLASDGQISFDILVQAFQDATSEGGQFADGMERQANTLAGVFSTLRDNVSIALGELGDNIAETFDLNQVVRDMTANLQQIVANFQELEEDSRREIIKVAALFTAGGPLLTGLGIATMAIARFVAFVNKRFLLISGVVVGTLGIVEQMSQRMARAIHGVEVEVDSFADGARKRLQSIIDPITEFGMEALGMNQLLQDARSLFDGLGGSDALESQSEDAEELSSSLGSANESASALGDSLRRVRSLAESPVDKIIDPIEIQEAARHAEIMEMSLEQLMNHVDTDIGTKLFPPGSLGALREKVSDLRQEMEFATDPEVQERLREELELTEEQIRKITGATRQATSAWQGFADVVGNALSNAVLHAESLSQTFDKLIKQLASRALQTALAFALPGGPAIGDTGFFSAMFGGMFHGGGVVPGVGERMIRATGGEVVLTPSQARALGGQSRPSVNIDVEKGFDRALSRHLKKLGPREVWVMSQEGRFQ